MCCKEVDINSQKSKLYSIPALCFVLKVAIVKLVLCGLVNWFVQHFEWGGVEGVICFLLVLTLDISYM